MESSDNISKIMQRTQRYWYEDGFQDMGFGAFIFALGLLFVAESLTPPGSPLWLVWGLAGPLLLLGGGVVISKVVRRLKERITWPRTGYVSYQRARGKSRLFRLLGVAVVSAGISAGIIVVQRNWLSLTVIFGLVYMATFTFLAFRCGLRRYLLLAIWCLGLGLALAPLPFAREQAVAIYHVGTGAAWILAGWLTWRHYNATAPRADQVDA
jgi:hypothetical protein